MSPLAPARVCWVRLGQLDYVAEVGRLGGLPPAHGRASGSESDTRRSGILSPRTRFF